MDNSLQYLTVVCLFRSQGTQILCNVFIFLRGKNSSCDQTNSFLQCQIDQS